MKALVVGSLAIALAGCGRSDRWSRDTRLWEVEGQRQRLYRMATLRDAIDSIPAILARLGDQPVGLVGLDSIPAAVREQIGGDARRLLAKAAAPSSDLRIVVFSYLTGFAAEDSTRRWVGYSGAVLPDQTDGRTCVVVTPRNVHWFSADRPGVARSWLETSLAPCLHLARFGPPGPAMRRWLEATSYRGIQSVDWLVRPAAPLAPDYWWYRDVFPDLQVGWGQLIVPLAAFAAGTPEVIPPYHWGAGAVGCLAGRLATCASMVTGNDSGRRWAAPIPGLVARTSDWYDRAIPIGPTRWSSELIRREGDLRFRRLWTASGDFETAFRDAYGDDLSRTVGSWAAVEWMRAGGRPVRLGATVDGSSVVATALWIALLLLIPVAGWRSRVIGQ